MVKLEHQHVVVTGGTRGIGLEFVSQLLQQGNTVLATGRDPSSSPGLQKLTEQYGDKLITASMDASDPDSVVQWAAALKEGGRIPHVDVLISNAGVLLDGFEERLLDFDHARFLKTISTNTLGPVMVLRELLKLGLLGGEQHSLVVHISSLAGSIGDKVLQDMGIYLYTYRASKAALNMLAVTSSRELADKNVTSVVLHPGAVNTDMNPRHDLGIPTAESVTAQLKILEGAEPVQSLNGKFYSYTGEELPW
eukprot:GHRQ01003754.1.p1 GENE.GHRQ01003754.1~~GHRQ01003754.1.p1  ORF type:complete len:251 (+),score=81.52 GHRQ01003754.1:491-1243(+)